MIAPSRDSGGLARGGRVAYWLLCYAFLSFLWSSLSLGKPLSSSFPWVPSSAHPTVLCLWFFFFFLLYLSRYLLVDTWSLGKYPGMWFFWYSRKNLMEASQEFLATRGIWTFKRPRYKDTAVVSLVTSDFQMCKYAHGMKFYHLSHTECTLQWPLGYSCLCWPPSSHPSQSFSVF